MSEFTKAIDEIRTTRIRMIEEAIVKTKDFLAVYPRDPRLPLKLEELKKLREEHQSRVISGVIHIDELKDYKDLKKIRQA